jgi:dehydrogenase/reductase SDR family protein 12
MRPSRHLAPARIALPRRTGDPGAYVRSTARLEVGDIAVPKRWQERIDWLMDKAVVPGYTRIGPAVRRRWWPDDVEPGSLAGRPVLVTGGGSGIGRATARQLGVLGATVHLLGADADQLKEAGDVLAAEAPNGRFELEVCDLADLPAVAAFAASFASRVPRLHALVHCAGTMSPDRRETDDGHELTLATHVLGPHLLTSRLVDVLDADGDGRIVWVSSGGMYASELRDDDPEFRRDNYSGEVAYARTKRMQLVLAELWAERLADRRVVSHSMHPGWVDTPGVRTFLTKFRALTLPFMRSADQGADTITWLVASPTAGRSTGQFWHDRAVRPVTYGRGGRESAERRQRFWDFCQAATA